MLFYKSNVCICIGSGRRNWSKKYCTNRYKIDTFVRDEVKQAVFDNGGIAIGILPTEAQVNYCGDKWKENLSIEEKENLIAQIKL